MFPNHPPRGNRVPVSPDSISFNNTSGKRVVHTVNTYPYQEGHLKNPRNIYLRRDSDLSPLVF